MLVHRRVTPSIKFAGTHLYTWVGRGTVRVKCLAMHTTQCPRLGLEPGPLYPESSALTVRPPRLPFLSIAPLIIFPRGEGGGWAQMGVDEYIVQKSRFRLHFELVLYETHAIAFKGVQWIRKYTICSSHTK